MAIVQELENPKDTPAAIRITFDKTIEVLPSTPGIKEQHLKRALPTVLPVVATDRILRAIPSHGRSRGKIYICHKAISSLRWN
jgi:hypothetical protein